MCLPIVQDCQAGYTGVTGQCEDVDECDSPNHPCGQICTNTIGSYNCSCRAGFEKNSEDPNTCNKVTKVETTFDFNTTNVNFTEGSEEFTKLTEDVEQAIFEKLQQTIPGLKGVRIIVIKPGSLIAEYELIIDIQEQEDYQMATADALTGLFCIIIFVNLERFLHKDNKSYAYKV